MGITMSKYWQFLLPIYSFNCRLPCVARSACLYFTLQSSMYSNWFLDRQDLDKSRTGIIEKARARALTLSFSPTSTCGYQSIWSQEPRDLLLRINQSHSGCNTRERNTCNMSDVIFLITVHSCAFSSHRKL